MMWNGGMKMRKRIYHERTELGPIAIYLRERGLLGLAVGTVALVAVSVWLILEVWG